MRVRLRVWWPRLRRLLTIAFLVAVIALLVNYARNVDWQQVASALRSYSPRILLIAGAIAIVSYITYASYDLLGRRYTGHDASVPNVLAVAFVSYVFNLNLGALIGGFAFRYRLYSRLGLSTALITQVLTVSIVTNWLGYIALAGGLFLAGHVPVPPGWEFGSSALRLLGGLFLMLVLAYLALCAFSSRRHWRIRGHEIELPSIRLAGAQLALGMANWSLMAAILYLLMPAGAGYFLVLGVLLVAGVAGAVTHVPAGLGVVEAVFVAILSGNFPQHELLAALFCYRAIYYLAPLAVATAMYVGLEARARRSHG